MENMKYIGTCHCGNIEFNFSSTLESPYRCNCSFCARRGIVVQKVDSSKFEIIEGGELLGKYGNRNFAKHYFCKNCGIHTFSKITRENESSVAINLACASNIKIDDLNVTIFDGANKL